MNDERVDRRYELRGLSLFVDGRAQPVSRATVKVAVARYWQETGRAPEWAEGAAPIPAALAHLILTLEAKVALAQLEALLHRGSAA